jgi:hypothetical protein
MSPNVRIVKDRIILDVAGVAVVLTDQDAIGLATELTHACHSLVVSEERERVLRLAAACELVSPEVM